jgi:hypothetical protein
VAGPLCGSGKSGKSDKSAKEEVARLLRSSGKSGKEEVAKVARKNKWQGRGKAVAEVAGKKWGKWQGRSDKGGRGSILFLQSFRSVLSGFSSIRKYLSPLSNKSAENY